MALQINHAPRQAAVARDPVSYCAGIVVPQSTRTHGARYGTAVLIRKPRCMETKPRTRRRAYPIARDNAEQKRASRQAIAVDHHPLAGRGKHGEILQVSADLAATVVRDTHRRRRRCDRRAQHSGGKQKSPKSHWPHPDLRVPKTIERKCKPTAAHPKSTKLWNPAIIDSQEQCADTASLFPWAPFQPQSAGIAGLTTLPT